MNGFRDCKKCVFKTENLNTKYVSMKGHCHNPPKTQQACDIHSY